MDVDDLSKWAFKQAQNMLHMSYQGLLSVRTSLVQDAHATSDPLTELKIMLTIGMATYRILIMDQELREQARQEPPSGFKDLFNTNPG